MILPKQEKFKLEPKNLMRKMQDIKISLKKLEIFIIKLLERLSGFFGKIFYNKIILTKKHN